MPRSALPRPSLMRASIGDLTSFWRQAAPDQRWMLWLAAALAASGAFHVLVWLASGESLEGPVSWRKPIVFGLSTAATTFSLAWIIGLLPATRRRVFFARLYTVMMAVEIALVDLQQWRGVGSHFNEATVFDGLIFRLMGIVILIASVSMVAFAVGVFRSKDLPADLRAAAVPAVALLLVSLALGVALSVYGGVLSAIRPEADVRIIGTSGVARFPHAVSLHALQVLPALLWLLARVTADVTRRTALLRLAAVGYGLVFLAAVWQTLAGRAPLELAWTTSTLFAIGGGLLVTPIIWALWRDLTTREVGHAVSAPGSGSAA